MTTTSSTFVITVAASITDNKIEDVVVEKIEIQTDDGQHFISVRDPEITGVSRSSNPDNPALQTQAEKSKSFEYIYADFKDGVGFQLVSINDTRLQGYFIPCYKIGANIRPAMGEKLIRSIRDVRNYRVSGYALVKCDEWSHCDSAPIW